MAQVLTALTTVLSFDVFLGIVAITSWCVKWLISVRIAAWGRVAGAFGSRKQGQLESGRVRALMGQQEEYWLGSARKTSISRSNQLVGDNDELRVAHPFASS